MIKILDVKVIDRFVTLLICSLAMCLIAVAGYVIIEMGGVLYKAALFGFLGALYLIAWVTS